MRGRDDMECGGERAARAYDYVIVGAGSAGCLLADRLSADGASVLVLEAGGPDRDPLIHVPIGVGKLHQHRLHDWGYDTEIEPGLARPRHRIDARQSARRLVLDQRDGACARQSRRL